MQMKKRIIVKNPQQEQKSIQQIDVTSLQKAFDLEQNCLKSEQTQSQIGLQGHKGSEKEMQKSKIVLNGNLQSKKEQLIQTNKNDIKVNQMNTNEVIDKNKQLTNTKEEQYLNQPHLNLLKSEKKPINFTISKSPKPHAQQNNTQNIQKVNESIGSFKSSSVISGDVQKVSDFQSKMNSHTSQSQERKNITDKQEKYNCQQTILVEVKPVSQVKNVQKKSQFLIEIPSLDSNEKAQQDNHKMKEDTLNKSFCSFSTGTAAVQIQQKQSLNKSFTHNIFNDSIKNDKKQQDLIKRILPEDISQIETQKAGLRELHQSKNKNTLDVQSSNQSFFSNNQLNQKMGSNKQQLQQNNMKQLSQNINDNQAIQQQNQEKLTNPLLESKISQKNIQNRIGQQVFQEKQLILLENVDKRSSSLEDAKQISNHFNSINKLVKNSFESANLQQQQTQPFQNQAQAANKQKINQKKRREDNNDKLDKLMDELIKLNQNKQNKNHFNLQKKQKINEQQVNQDNEKQYNEQDLLSLKQTKLNQIFTNSLQKSEIKSEQQETKNQTKKQSREEENSKLQTRKYQQRNEFEYNTQNNQLQKSQQDIFVQQKQLQRSTQNNNNNNNQKEQLNNQESSLINSSFNNIKGQISQNNLNQEQKNLQLQMLKAKQNINNCINQILDKSNQKDSDLNVMVAGNIVRDDIQKNQIVIGSNEKIYSIASSNEGLCEILEQDVNLQKSKDSAINLVCQNQSSLSTQNLESKEKQQDQQNCMIIQIDSSKSLEKDQMEIEKEDNKQAIATPLAENNQMMEKKHALEIEIKKINHAIKSLGKKKLSFLKNRERKILKLKSYLIRQKNQIDQQLKQYNTQKLNQFIKQKQELQQKMLEEMLKKQLEQQLNQVQNKKSYFQKQLKKCQFVVQNEVNFDNYIVMENQKRETKKRKQEEKDQQDKQNNQSNISQSNLDMTKSDQNSENKLLPQQNCDNNDNYQDQQIINVEKQVQIEQDSVIQQQNQEILAVDQQQNVPLRENCHSQSENSKERTENNTKDFTIQQEIQINQDNQIQIEEEEIKSRNLSEENNDQQYIQFNSSKNEQAQNASPISTNQSCILIDSSSQATPEVEGKYQNNNNLNKVNQYSSNINPSENSNKYNCDQHPTIESSVQNLKVQNSVQQKQKQKMGCDLDKTQIINVEIENNININEGIEEENQKNIQNDKIHQKQLEIPQIGDEDIFESRTDKQKKCIQETVIIDDLFEPENKITKPKGKEQIICTSFSSSQENLNNDQSSSQINQDKKFQVIVIDDLFIDRQIGFNKVQENIKNSTQLQKQEKNNQLPLKIQQDQQAVKSESKQEKKIKKKMQENWFQTIISLIKTCSYFGLSGYYHTIYKMQEQQELESQKQVCQELDLNQSNQFNMSGRVQTSNQQYTFSFYKHPDNLNNKQSQPISNNDQQINQNLSLIRNKQIFVSNKDSCVSSQQPKIITLKNFIIKKKEQQNEDYQNQATISSQKKQNNDMDLQNEETEKLNCQKAMTKSSPKLIRLTQPIKHFKIIKK
ncbi:hypothetical protein TTHERM_01367700 (macronuclear) [Tetrahymena thermophila SB210]|uniref:Uncharacterized protein n=1 Tax=Tetrahymena thermophila (strain SB210) TaxID=312017 RepID=Q24E15_TETTS|nr:hypothetical protein TTHERM_01367700 [Tetrahymena thermophila SB210]EAS06023.1 hypothetical protein TTHERM_01367700 [Tetrahymena thermophila SB210]|eukprot:XP_001026268.1 hypothetical protein TTHERM_01367700 [Tetrahymena thermophila SB210]